MPLLAVIRVKGTVNVPRAVKDTLKMLRLYKRNHMVLVENSKPILGMLKKAQHYITWGEIDKETLALVLERRARLRGNKRLTKEALSKIGFNSYEELAESLLNKELKLKDIYKYIKPVFRLTPPSGGFKGTIKKLYSEGGELGYRGSDINSLIRRMI